MGLIHRLFSSFINMAGTHDPTSYFSLCMTLAPAQWNWLCFSSLSHLPSFQITICLEGSASLFKGGRDTCAASFGGNLQSGGLLVVDICPLATGKAPVAATCLLRP